MLDLFGTKTRLATYASCISWKAIDVGILFQLNSEASCCSAGFDVEAFEREVLLHNQ